MITIGLDLSLTKTGYAVLKEDGSVVVSGVLKSKPAGDKPVDEVRRIKGIVRQLTDIIDHYDDLHCLEMVAIEGLAFMAKGTSLVQLAALNYMVRSNLDARNKKFLIVAPTSLKKFVTGSGKGDKDQMMMAIFKEYGHESLDNNECDAYALAVLALATLGKPVKKLIIPQVEVINLLKKQI